MEHETTSGKKYAVKNKQQNSAFFDCHAITGGQLTFRSAHLRRVCR
jgi:hypothetical protein